MGKAFETWGSFFPLAGEEEGAGEEEEGREKRRRGEDERRRRGEEEGEEKEEKSLLLSCIIDGNLRWKSLCTPILIWFILTFFLFSPPHIGGSGSPNPKTLASQRTPERQYARQ